MGWVLGTGSTKEKKFFVALGMSNTGKSVFWNAIAGALGEGYAITSSALRRLRTQSDPKGRRKTWPRTVARAGHLPEPHEGYKLSMRSSSAQPAVTNSGTADAENGFHVYAAASSLCLLHNFAIRFDGAIVGCKPVH